MNFYEEIESLIKKSEINKRARYLKDNSDILNNYWEIGKLIVEAQGGESRAKYGDSLIKNWSEKLVKLYGSGYRTTSLKYMRQFYMVFPNGQPMVDGFTWSHYLQVIYMKEENKRNYYINLCIARNLSKRELIAAIKDNEYERLLVKPKKIEIIGYNERKYNVREHIKNPIIIKLNDNDKILREKDLQMKILAQLQNFFRELGNGYAFIDNEYKIKLGTKTYLIDILLFNVEMNAYVVVELKLRELKKEDKAQMEFYMNLVDTELKREFHNDTVGIIVSKYQDKYILNFVSKSNIIPLTYKLENEKDALEASVI